MNMQGLFIHRCAPKYIWRHLFLVANVSETLSLLRPFHEKRERMYEQDKISCIKLKKNVK